MTQRAGQRSGLKGFYIGLAVLAAVGIVALGTIVLRNRSAKAAAEPIAVEGAENPQALVAKATGVTVGPAEAPTKLLVFSDYQCPYCASYAAEIEPVLVNDYVNAGKMQLVYYDFPLGGAHRFSFLASRAARCAGDQNKFWQYHDLLFGRQSEWSVRQDMPVGDFLDYGKELGLDEGAFKSCVKSDKYQEVVSANRLLGERLGVNGTPTTFINGKRIPNEIVLDIKALRELIETELGSAPAPAPAAAPAAQ